MNSYTLTEKLRKARRKHAISASAQGLYYELVAINNEDQWSSVFTCSNGELMGALTIAEKTLISLRDELAAANLVVYSSGKSKRKYCDYSFNGGLNYLPIGLRNGGKIYSSSESQPVSRLESQSVENSTDYNKHKTETKTITSLEVVVDDSAGSRQSEFNQLADEYFAERDKNSNASLPEQAYLPNEQKEKSSAKKEKEFPTLQMARDKLLEMASWRNVLEHHKVTEDEREDLFKLFYEQKEDNYRLHYPTAKDMAANFYFWISARKRLEVLKPQLGITNANTITKTNTGNRARTEETKRGVEALKHRSGEFLRKSAG